MNRIGLTVGAVLIALMIAFSTLFIVDQRQFAVIYALGEIKEVVTEPGLLEEEGDLVAVGGGPVVEVDHACSFLWLLIRRAASCAHSA